MTWETSNDKVERWKTQVDREVAEGQGAVTGGLCPGRIVNGKKQTCKMQAGFGTDHMGAGLCWTHGGNSKRERVRGAWLMAHKIALSLNVTPADALLGEVRRSAGEVAWLDWKVGEAPSDEALVEDPIYRRFYDMRVEARKTLARVSKMALDAAVDAALVSQMTGQGELIAKTLLRTLERLGLSDEIMDLARGILRQELLAIEAQALGVTSNGETLEGTIVTKE